MNDLTPIPNTELPKVSDVDPLVAYADAVSPRHIVGKLLRFIKGDYFAGEGSEPVPIGTKFTVAADELLAGWIKWADGKPAEHIMVRVADGKLPSKRSDLGDQDRSAWETDDHNEPRDPWQFTNYLPMMDENGVLYTFTTSSAGGRATMSDLARRYGRHRRHHPDVYPIISLSVGSYPHKKKEYGRIKYPEFTPAGYEPKAKFLAALEAAGSLVAELSDDGSALPPPQPDELSDEVPF
jgi:hypothetical protein